MELELDEQLKVYRVMKCQGIPFVPEVSNESKEALHGVLTLLEDHFYFSNDFDLTRRLQRRLEISSPPNFSTADPRFVWNSSLCNGFFSQNISERWFTPVMQGFVQCQELPGRDGKISLVLLARRSSYHAGTRNLTFLKIEELFFFFDIFLEEMHSCILVQQHTIIMFVVSTEPFYKKTTEGWFFSSQKTIDLFGRFRPPSRLVAFRGKSVQIPGYNARGLDDDAEAANWVETEMLAKPWFCEVGVMNC